MIDPDGKSVRELRDEIRDKAVETDCFGNPWACDWFEEAKMPDGSWYSIVQVGSAVPREPCESIIVQGRYSEMSYIDDGDIILDGGE